MAGFDGAHVLVLVKTGEDASTGEPIYEPVAAQTGFDTSSSREMLDGSVKGTDHAQSAYGRMETTASMSALVSLGDGTQQALLDAMQNREPVLLRYRISGDVAPSGADEHYEAEALVSSVERSFPDNENSTFSAEFTLNEFWRAVTV